MRQSKILLLRLRKASAYSLMMQKRPNPKSFI